MPTSGTYEWVKTAGDLARNAAVEIGAIPMGDELNDSEWDEAQDRLNNMLKTWSVEGNLFRYETGTVIIPAGAGAAMLPIEVMTVLSARRIVTATNHRVLGLWNRDEWMSIPNRVQAGYPSAFYVDPQIGGLQIRVWPVPAAEITLDLDFGRRCYTVTAPDQEVDVPPEWNEAVFFGLAQRMVNMFGAAKLDPTTVQRVDAMANATYRRLLDADRPDSYYMVTESRVYG